MAFNELDMVKLAKDIPEKGLKKGDEGTIVEVPEGGEEIYNVEFEVSGGDIVYAAVGSDDIEGIGEEDA